MKKLIRALGATLTFALATTVYAAPPMPPTKVSMEVCMFAALKAYPGAVEELEFGTDNVTPVYEFEIETLSGREVEVECDANTGKIVEAEYEDVDLKRFLQMARISDMEALRIALEEVPGTVVGIEHEITVDGRKAYYEFEIRTAHTVREVEIDAGTGKIVEVETQIYEIGDD